MAYAKVVVNGATVMDVTNDTVTASTLLHNIQATQANGTKVSGTIQGRSSVTINPTSQQQIAVSAGTYMSGSVIVNAIPNNYIVPSGTFEVTRAGDNIDIAQYSILSVTGRTGNSAIATLYSSQARIGVQATYLQGFYEGDHTYTNSLFLPSTSISFVSLSTSSQVAVSKYTWTLNDVVVEAIPDSYVIPTGTYTVTASGSGINITNYASLNVPSGDFSITYGLQSSSAQVSIDIRTNPVGWINKQAAHTVSLPSTTVSHVTPTLSAQTIIPQYRWTLNSVVVDAMPTPTILPTVSGSAYFAATSDYDFGVTVTIPEGYYSETTVSQNFASVFPALGSNQAIASHVLLGREAYDGEGHIITGTMTSIVGVATTLTSTTTTYIIPAGYHDGTGTVSHQTVTVPNPSITFNSTTRVITASSSWTRGFTTNSSYTKTYTISAGTVVPPTTVTGTGATVTTGTNTLTLTSSVAITPNVTTAGWISSGTASTRAVTLTANVTTKGAASITPTSAAQTAVAANTYVTGAITVAAIPASYKLLTSTTTATASDILSGLTAYNSAGTYLTGTMQVITYYTGSSSPASSLGSNGDIYLMS